MLLPPTLGLFVRQLGARPYVRESTSLEPYTENLRYDVDQNEEFGLSGVYDEGDSTLKIILAEREGGVPFAALSSVTLGLYRVQTQSRTDELIRAFQLDLDLMFENRFELTQRISDGDELVLACLLVTTTNKQLNFWIPVEHDGLQDTNSILDFVVARQSVGLDRYEEVPTTTMQATEGSEPSRIELDFKLGDPRVRCSGDLSYQGGGNRYLFNQDGEAVEQKIDQAPWDLNSGCFVEPQTQQLYSDFGLHDNNYTYTKLGFITLETFQTFDLFPQHRMIVYAVQAPAHSNSTWEWKTDPATWTGTTCTFSGFVEITQSLGSKLVFELGVRITETNGTLRTEIAKEINAGDDFGLQSITYAVPALEAPGRIQGFLRIKHMYPGDRAVFGLAMPQIELGGSASSRCYGLRASDVVTYVPDAVDYNRDFGMFRVNLYPGYDSIPTFPGEQWFFDTRSSSGLNGWYLVHRHNGVLEFGCVGLTLSTKHSVESASVIQFGSSQQVEITCWYGDFGLRLDVNGNRSGSNHLAIPETPDMLAVIRLGRDYSESKTMTGEYISFLHEAITNAFD